MRVAHDQVAETSYPTEKAGLDVRFYVMFTVIILISALAFRLVHLQSKSLWIDEAYSYWFTTRTLSNLWHVVPLYETHPPLYYTLLTFWVKLFNDSESAMRSLSVVFSLASIAVLLVGARLANLGRNAQIVTLAAAWLLAINSGNVDYAQQARPYAMEELATLVTVIAALFVLRDLQSPVWRNDKTLRVLPLCILALGGGWTLWSHNTGTLVVFAIWVALGFAVLSAVPRKIRAIGMLVLPLLGAIAIWSPFIPMFLVQSKGVIHGFWATFKLSDIEGAFELLAGGKKPLPTMIFFGVIGLVGLWRLGRAYSVFIGLLLAIPFIIVVGVSETVRPIFIPRLFEWMTPEFMALLVIGIFTLLPWPRIRGVVIALASLLCFSSMASAMHAKTDDWRVKIDALQQQFQPGDLLILSPNELETVFSYYPREGKPLTPTLVLPAPFPALGLPGRDYVSNLGAPALIPSDANTIADASAHSKRVWLVERKSELFDPKHIAQNALLARYHLVKQTDLGYATISLYE